MGAATAEASGADMRIAAKAALRVKERMIASPELAGLNKRPIDSSPSGSVASRWEVIAGGSRTAGKT
ncbi:hypothetical protein GCM10010836_28840 [Aminobacter aminovorans]